MRAYLTELRIRSMIRLGIIKVRRHLDYSRATSLYLFVRQLAPRWQSVS